MGCLSALADEKQAEIIPLEPEPDNAGVGKRQSFSPFVHIKPLNYEKDSTIIQFLLHVHTCISPAENNGGGQG